MRLVSVAFRVPECLAERTAPIPWRRLLRLLALLLSQRTDVSYSIASEHKSAPLRARLRGG